MISVSIHDAWGGESFWLIDFIHLLRAGIARAKNVLRTFLNVPEERSSVRG